MMTDAEVKDQVERTDAFIERLRTAVDEAIAAVDPHSSCAAEARAGLARIAATLDHVDYTLLANLSNLDAALQNRTGTGLIDIIAVHLLAVGGGPTLDHADAAAFLRPFERMVDLARKWRIN